MINLFEDYSQGSWDLHYSLIVAGYVNTTVCLSDNGFLPSDVTSPYLFFTGFDKVQGDVYKRQGLTSLCSQLSVLSVEGNHPRAVPQRN